MVVRLLTPANPSQIDPAWKRIVGGRVPNGGGGVTVDEVSRQHFAWLARSFGRTDYLPLRESDLEALASTGEVLDKYPGTHLFKQGDESRDAFVLERGQVELFRGDQASKRVVGRAGPGSVLGDIAMFQGEPYKLSARAMTRIVVFKFDRDRLLPVLMQRPIITLRWLVAGLTQLESTQRRVLGLMQRTVKEQLAELILDECDLRGEVHLSQAAMAGLLGASRQTVNEALGSLRDEGAIETAYRRVHLVDRAKLEMVAGR